MRSYKRGRIWWLEWYENGGKRRESTGCRDAKAAEAYRRRRERELADPTHAAADQATVTSAATRFLNELRASKPREGTLNMYECKIGHVARLLGTKRLSKISAEDVKKYIATRREETASDHTIHKELVALRQTLKSAAFVGELARDPRTIIPRFSTDYTPRDRWVEIDDVLAVIHHLEPERGAFVAFLAATGCRRREAELARVGDVESTTILIRGTKTAKSFRRIPIVSLVEPFVDYVRKHAQGAHHDHRNSDYEQGTTQRALGEGDRAEFLKGQPEPVDARSDGARTGRGENVPRSPSTGSDRRGDRAEVTNRALLRPWASLRRDLHAACERAGVATFGPNELRHSYATWLVKRGAPFQAVAKVLGHASTSMLERVYGNLDAGDVGVLIERRLSQHQEEKAAELAHNRGTIDVPTVTREGENASEVQH